MTKLTLIVFDKNQFFAKFVELGLSQDWTVYHADNLTQYWYMIDDIQPQAIVVSEELIEGDLREKLGSLSQTRLFITSANSSSNQGVLKKPLSVNELKAIFKKDHF